MTGEIRHRVGQSIYDLCLQAYGNYNHLIKFANDNGVTNLQQIPQQTIYKYDKSLAQYENNPNIYTTAANSGRIHGDEYGAEYE